MLGDLKNETIKMGECKGECLCAVEVIFPREKEADVVKPPCPIYSTENKDGREDKRRETTTPLEMKFRIFN